MRRTRKALDDDALENVTGGAGNNLNPEAQAWFSRNMGTLKQRGGILYNDMVIAAMHSAGNGNALDIDTFKQKLKQCSLDADDLD